MLVGSVVDDVALIVTRRKLTLQCLCVHALP